jgi:hypothetical protein
MSHRLAGLLVALAAAVPLAAQSDETLFSGRRGRGSIGGFGAPAAVITSVDGEATMMVGGGGALLLGRHLAIGVAGYGTVSDGRRDRNFRPADGIEFGYGGLTLAWITQPSRLVHLTGGVLIGAGVVESGQSQFLEGNRNLFSSNLTRYQYGYRDEVAIIEPDLSAEVNLTRWMRMTIGGGYRFAPGGEGDRRSRGLNGLNPLSSIALPPDAYRLAGPTARLAIKFGKF